MFLVGGLSDFGGWRGGSKKIDYIIYIIRLESTFHIHTQSPIKF